MASFNEVLKQITGDNQSSPSEPQNEKEKNGSKKSSKTSSPLDKNESTKSSKISKTTKSLGSENVQSIDEEAQNNGKVDETLKTIRRYKILAFGASVVATTALVVALVCLIIVSTKEDSHQHSYKICVPNTVAFMATTAKVSLIASTSGTFIFENVNLNIGKSYNSNTGIFRCNISGVYRFTVHIFGRPNKPFLVQLRVNNDVITSTGAYDDAENGASLSAVVELQKGAEVRVWHGAQSRELYRSNTLLKPTVFSGVLVAKGGCMYRQERTQEIVV